MRLTSLSIILLGTLCVGILFVWIVVPRLRTSIDKFSPLFSIIASIAALSVFIQIYQTYEQSVKDTSEKNREIRAGFNARMSGLSAEIINNIQYCNLFKSESPEYLSGRMTPGIRFSYGIATKMIQNGDITHHKLRAEIMSLVSQMQSLNSLIDQNMNLMMMKSLAPKSQNEGARLRIIASMKLFVGHIDALRAQLVKTQPLIEEYWKDPEKFRDEKYLHDRLIPDGLIR